MTVWLYGTADAAAPVYASLPDEPRVRRGVITWRDGWKHPQVSVHESRSLGEVGRDYLQGFIGMGMGSSRGTAYSGVSGVELELVIDARIADELEDALSPGTSAIVVVADDGGDMTPVAAAVTGATEVLMDRELGQDEQVLRS